MHFCCSNVAKQPTSDFKVVALEDSPRLVLIAKHDIEVGAELLFDYGERNKDIIKSNPWLGE